MTNTGDRRRKHRPVCGLRWPSLGLGAKSEAFALLLIFVCCTTACRSERSRDCETFVTSVNGVLKAIDRHITQVDGGELTNVNDMRELARLYQTLDERINQMRLTTPELTRESQAYRTMVNTAASAAIQVADALAAEDLEKALVAQNQFARVVAEEDKVVKRINGFCAAR